jgi:hypothetical protein
VIVLVVVLVVVEFSCEEARLRALAAKPSGSTIPTA